MNNHFFRYTLFAIILAATPPSSWAQLKNTSSARAQALCPEISKLAESVALAHNVGLTQEESIGIINQTAKFQPEEIEVVNQLITYVYAHPEMSPYEHGQNAQAQCYKHIP